MVLHESGIVNVLCDAIPDMPVVLFYWDSDQALAPQHKYTIFVEAVMPLAVILC
jgi:hypothetical protein